MSLANTEDVTRILEDWNRGDQSAIDRLLPIVYEELRRRAAEYLRAERPDHTLQETELVHEYYLVLVDQIRATDSPAAMRSTDISQALAKLAAEAIGKQASEAIQ